MMVRGSDMLGKMLSDINLALHSTLHYLDYVPITLQFAPLEGQKTLQFPKMTFNSQTKAGTFSNLRS